MTKSILTGLALLAATSLWAAKPEKYVKEVTFPAGATLEQKLDMASRLVPDKKQLDWQNCELTAFLHFGVNTFTDREWGDGKENPAVFNPVGLDADQWVKTLKDAGFKLVILTAKHHDGFCLWPTATTKHSVASSPWKDGKGDVVKELRKACDKYGMKMGVYLSPWDRNAECYGDSPRYNDMFVAQLTELLSNYGRIDEVWFDGACGEGPNGKKQEYDWARFKKVIGELQPGAVTAIMGDDVRWVGNEAGKGRETEWSATALTPGILPGAEEANKRLGIDALSRDLGGREILAKADKLYWWPSEVDVSIRPGWFYHDKEQPKSLNALAKIYLNSVGRNSVLLLNIPPDRNGRIASADSVRLMELRRWIDTNFSNNLIRKYNKKTDSWVFKKPALVNTVLVRENITEGQRVEKFDVQALVAGKWTTVASGTTIGVKRIIVFPQVKASALRLVITSVRGKADIAGVEAYDITLPGETSSAMPGYKTLPAAGWTVTSDTQPAADAAKAFDGNPDTYWTSAKGAGVKTFAVDMQKDVPVAGFVYTPRGGDDKAGTIFHYRFYTSTDGKEWKQVPASGEFSNIVNNPISQNVFFAPVKARYFKIEALDEVAGRDYVTIGDISILAPTD